MTFPTLTTERLTLRVPEADDFQAFAAFARSDRARFIRGTAMMDDKAIGRAFGDPTKIISRRKPAS